MTKLTMLNSMAGSDFNQSLDTHVEWGLEALDLKDRIWGKPLLQLSAQEAQEACQAIQERGLYVYCMSTDLFHDDIERGEHYFQERHVARIDKALEVAAILKPTVIRLLSAKSEKRSEFTDSISYIHHNAPWLIPMYREAIDRIAAAGFEVTIENECERNLMSTPEEILAFFKEIDRPNNTYFTYDVQNLWQMGTFPSIEAYRRLKPLIGYFHLKGGRTGDNGDKLVWRSSLEDASWPVAQLTKQVIADGVSKVICLNPSHGQKQEGYNYDNLVERDLKYVQGLITAGERLHE
jgi:sugar phosphate isomerase/epimerase